jgi:excisionase family DNA binding protein
MSEIKKQKPIAIPASAVSPDALLSCKQAAAILNISAKTVQRLCTAGRLSYIPITPTLFRIRRGALDVFMSKTEARVL